MIKTPEEIVNEYGDELAKILSDTIIRAVLKKHIEQVSDYVHKMWADWFLYFIKNMWNPINLIRWFKQSKTDYKNLSEEDKDKDRKFALEIIKIIKSCDSESKDSKKGDFKINNCYNEIEQMKRNIKPMQRKCAKYFNKELDYIQIPAIKNAVMDFIDDCTPDYFWKIPASTSGKYHPKYTLVEGGLVLHTKAAVEIARQLFNIYDLPTTSKDIIISALILHDMFKCGSEEQEENCVTLFSHPTICAQKFLSYHNAKIKDEKCATWYLFEIANCISSHMGKWNTNVYDSSILPLPTTQEQRLVHLCDYLASRENIEVKFC